MCLDVTVWCFGPLTSLGRHCETRRADIEPSEWYATFKVRRVFRASEWYNDSNAFL